MEILVDADMVLEALLNRSGFVADSEDLLDLVQTKQIQGYVSELGLDKIYSIASRLDSYQAAEEVVSAIKAIMTSCSVDSDLLQQARQLNLRDFESAVEVSCATAMNIGAIVTQEPKNFVGANLPVLSLSDLLRRQHLERILEKNTSPVLLVGDLLEVKRLEELLERSNECLGEILDQSHDCLETILGNDGRGREFSARHYFDSEFSNLLKSTTPKANSVLVFIQYRLRQFNLDTQLSHEILNEAYIRGVKSISQGKQIQSPLAWIKGTAFNIIREFSRSQRKTLPVDSNLIEYSFALALPASEEEAEPHLLQVLKMALRQLESRDRRILHLRIVKGLSWHQVGKHLILEGEEVQSDAVLRSRGHRALKRLRQIYHALLSEGTTDY